MHQMQHLITLRFTFCKVFHISLFHKPHKCPTKFALRKSSFERPKFYSPNTSTNTHSSWDSNTRSEERETEPQPSELSRQEVAQHDKAIKNLVSVCLCVCRHDYSTFSLSTEVAMVPTSL
jgi:hypothetical protein